eukprot:403342450
MGYQALFITSGQFTLVTHTSIIFNLAIPLLVIYRLLCKQPYHKFEIYGTIIGFVGCIITVFDKKAQKVDTNNQHILFGDSMAVIGSVVVCFYLIKNRELVRTIPAFFGVALSTVVAYILLGTYGLLLGGFTFDFSLETGMFGFLVSNEIWYCIFALGFYCGSVVYCCNALSQQIFSPLIIATSKLFEPVISQTMACLLGIDKMPGLPTIMGCSIALGGIFLVSYGGFTLQEKQKIINYKNQNQTKLQTENQELQAIRIEINK